MANQQATFIFSFYRFEDQAGVTTTKIVREPSEADGMRALVDMRQADLAAERATAWAAKNGLTATKREPYPSNKYPGKVWLDIRFGGLAL